MHRIQRAAFLLIAALMLAACRTAGGPPPVMATPTSQTASGEDIPVDEPTPTSPAPTVEAAAEAASTTEPTVVGPEDYPVGVNPLTGLPVDDSSVLERRPIIVKVSNQSDEVRPQSGLSYADNVWMYQAEGWQQTRYAAIYYSQSPEYVGSVRSARPIDEHLMDMYDALMVISGASKDMYRELMNAPWWDRVFRDDGTGHLIRLEDVPREDVGYYHSLFAIPEVVWEHADERGVNATPDLGGLVFDQSAPEGGTPTTEMSIDYPDIGPRQTWRYDEASGRWLSWTEIQLELPPYTSTPDEDYLTGEQLAFDNVVVIWAEHDWMNDFVEVPALGVTLTGEGDALLLRDGQRYEITWRRDDPNHMIQFYGADGEPIAFKPGTTWFNTAQLPDDADHTPELTFDGES